MLGEKVQSISCWFFIRGHSFSPRMSKLFCWDLVFLRRNGETVQKQQPELPFDLDDINRMDTPQQLPALHSPFQLFFSRFLLSAIEVWDPLVRSSPFLVAPVKKKWANWANWAQCRRCYFPEVASGSSKLTKATWRPMGLRSALVTSEKWRPNVMGLFRVSNALRSRYQGEVRGPYPLWN